MAKYLDYTGLGYYDGKIKEWVESQINGGVISIADAVETADGKLTFEYTKKDDTTGEFTVTKDQLDTVIGTAAEQGAGGLGLMTKEQSNQLANLVNVGGEVNVIEGVALNGEVFAIDADKIASATMTFDWESDSSDKIVLKIEDTVIGEIDTTKFVKDGIVSEAKLITIPDNEEATTERPAGKYIKITWSGDAGTDPTYINVTALVDIHNVVGDETLVGDLVKVNTAVTGSGTSEDPWKVSIKSVDESVLKANFKKTIGANVGDTFINVNNTGSSFYVREKQNAVEAVLTLDEQLYNTTATANAAVKKVNSVSPDTNGNVTLTGANINSGISQEGAFITQGGYISDCLGVLDEVLDRVRTDLYAITAITNGEIDALFA